MILLDERTGQLLGTSIALIVLVSLILIAALVFCIRKRRANKEDSTSKKVFTEANTEGAVVETTPMKGNDEETAGAHDANSAVNKLRRAQT